MTITELFAQTAAQAMTLDPSRIEATIRDTAGGWPGGGNGEPVSGGGTSDPTATAAIRAVSHPRDDLADIPKLHQAVSGFVSAVASISLQCMSGPPPTRWSEAVQTARLLANGPLAAALDVGIRLDRHIYRADEAVLTIRRIHDGHMAHKPDDSAKLMTGDPVCLSHARIGDYDRRRWTDHRVCRVCHDLLAQVGNPSELDNDPDAWPPVELLREHADMERTGRRTDYRRERTLWIERMTSRRWTA